LINRVSLVLLVLLLLAGLNSCGRNGYGDIREDVTFVYDLNDIPVLDFLDRIGLDELVGSGDRPFSMYPYIYLPPKHEGTFTELAWIEHELVHAQDQRSYRRMFAGLDIWYIRYFADKGFRLKSEKKALRVELMFYFDNGYTATDRTVRSYSKGLVDGYWGMISEEDAKQFIIDVIEEWNDNQN